MFYRMGNWFSTILGRGGGDDGYSPKARRQELTSDGTGGGPVSLPSISRTVAARGSRFGAGNALELRSRAIKRQTPELAQPERPAPRVSATASRKECLACLEELPSSSFPKKPISPGCDHPASQICLPCLERSLEAQLDGLVVQGFTCPLCKMPISDRDAQRWAKPEVFNRYKRLLERRALTEDPNFIWCSNPRCDKGQTHIAGATSPIIICKYCHTRTCFTHQRPWHEGMTCYEFDHPEVIGKGDEAAASNKGTGKRISADEAVAGQLKSGKLNGPSRTIADQKTRAKRRVLVAKQKAEERRREQEEERRRKKDQRNELLQRREEERRGEALVNRTSRACGGCGYRVTKIGGCSHMVCELNLSSRLKDELTHLGTRCGYDWTWFE
ncbi:hypothetical protein BDW62DRAFT_185989 [Aspergillus aurantiobrunneus]